MESSSKFANWKSVAYLYVPCASLLDTTAYDGSRFSEIHASIFSEPYAERPVYHVDVGLFGPGGKGTDNAPRAAARCTLTVEDDLVEFPHGQKLLQANGICFAGDWVIDQASP